MQNKKPGMAVTIAVARKRPESDDIGEPGPLEREQVPAEEDMRHEEGESSMDFGLIGEKFGLNPEESRAFAYDVLEACMKATGGARHEAEEPEMTEEESPESDDEEYER